MVVASGFSKEMSIRKRIANIYNKREENFPSLREYNDYLEEVEDMIFNLIEGIEVPAIEAKIAQYQRENAEQIMIAQARKAEEYAAALAASKGQSTQSDGDALGQCPQAGSSTGPQGHYAPAIAGGIAQPRPTQPLPVESIPDMLVGEYEDDETMKLRIERAARAGGWSSEISRKRALEEAYGSESCKDTFPRLSFSFVTFCGFWKNSEKFIQVPSMEQHLSICHHDGFCS